MEEKASDVNLGKYFLDMTTKAHTTKIKINEINIKLIASAQ